MPFAIATYGLAYAAGLLSTLSPCVLPLVPLVLASAAAAHRWGVAALTAGLALSFAATGTLLAALGTSLGIDDDMLRTVSAVLLVAAGAVTLLPALQRRFASATSGLSAVGHTCSAAIDTQSLRGQFAIGLLLGTIWSPCAGPTLGAAIALAEQGKALGPIATLMTVYAAGACTPMVVLGTASRASVAKLRERMRCAGSFGKPALGLVLVTLGLFTLTHADRYLETWATQRLPSAIVDLTTRF
jgi:cytochrome c biogenesis protein CcdA